MAQYAILNLATLHLHFGHEDQSIQAIHETVRIAQQNNDHVCLMHALSLLCQVSSVPSVCPTSGLVYDVWILTLQVAIARGDTEYAGQLLQRCVDTQVQLSKDG